MKWVQTAVIAMAIVICCLAVFGQTAGEIGIVDGFIGDGPWASWSGRWLALVERNGAFELRDVTVITTRSENRVCDDMSFAFNVTATPAVSGSLLLRGFPAIKAGTVATMFHGHKFLLPGESLNLSPEWSLEAFGTARPTSSLSEPRIIDYRVYMTGSGGRTAVLFSLDHVDNDKPPEILWVGDLDADGVPDVFADIATHYNASRRTLFLSSRARVGRLLEEAGAVYSTGC